MMLAVGRDRCKALCLEVQICMSEARAGNSLWVYLRFWGGGVSTRFGGKHEI